MIRDKPLPRQSARLQPMLAGELATTAQQRRTEAPHLIHLLRGDLDWIVMKCLEKDRRRRYETANALALEIRRYLHNEPVMARPPTAIYKFQKAWRRNKGLYAACAVVALALGAGLSAALLARKSEASQRQRVERTLYAADLNLAARDLNLTNRGHAWELLTNYWPRAGREDLRGWEWHYLWKFCQTKELFPLTGHKAR